MANAQDFESYVSSATKSFEDGMFRKAYENSTKAIELDSTNLDIRWIRAQSALTQSAPKDRIEVAIKDLKAITTTSPTAKAYNALGVAEMELASYIYRFDKAKQKPSFSDDNSAYLKEQTAFYNSAIAHYEKAKVAFEKSAKAKPDTAKDIGYKLLECDKKIATINEDISKLK